MSSKSSWPLLLLGGTVLLAAAVAAYFAGRPSAGRKAERLTVCTHLFALHEWAARVAGPDADAVLLEGSGGDPHTFSLNPADATQIARAHVLLLIGLDFDAWAERAVENAPGGIQVWEARAWVKLREMGKADEGEHHDHGHDHHHHHDHGNEDPHLWLDPDRAAKVVEELGARFGTLDPAHAQGYTQRAAAYAAELRACGKELDALSEQVSGRWIVVFHDAYGYLFDRLGLKLAGTIQNSPGVEPTPRDVTDALAKYREIGQKVVFAEPGNQAAAEAIARELGGPVVLLDPLESTGFAPGQSYLDRLRANLAKLKEHLP